MAQEQQGAKHSPLGYPRDHGCFTGELAINQHSHLALCEEFRKPLVQGSLDAILFQLIKEFPMGDSVESYGKVQYSNIGLDVLVKGFSKVMEGGDQLGLTEKNRTKAMI